jgi:hypothetical protein
MSRIAGRKPDEGVLRNPRNEVFLEGRVSSELGREATPPSEISWWEFRIVIDRPQSRSKSRSKACERSIL